MSTVVNVRFSEEELEQLRVFADERGLALSTCIRMLTRQAMDPKHEANQLLLLLQTDMELRLRFRRLLLFDPKGS